jgi:hypothetical protein
MGEVKAVITMLGVVAVVLLVLLALCRFMGLWTWTVAWLLSSREEKVGLTRAMGHYNANGYLVRRFLRTDLKGLKVKFTGSVHETHRWTLPLSMSTPSRLTSGRELHFNIILHLHLGLQMTSSLLVFQLKSFCSL